MPAIVIGQTEDDARRSSRTRRTASRRHVTEEPTSVSAGPVIRTDPPARSSTGRRGDARRVERGAVGRGARTSSGLTEAAGPHRAGEFDVTSRRSQDPPAATATTGGDSPRASPAGSQVRLARRSSVDRRAATTPTTTDRRRRRPPPPTTRHRPRRPPPGPTPTPPRDGVPELRRDQAAAGAVARGSCAGGRGRQR